MQMLAVGKSFNKLRQNEYMLKNGVLWNHNVTFAACKNDKGELMVIASSTDTDIDIFNLYRYRWSIERLFKHLKTAGFDIEKSHITDLARFAKLIAICSIACAIIVKNGVLRDNRVPVRLKKYKNKDSKSPLFSLFTYGIDNLKHTILRGAKIASTAIKLILKSLDISQLIPSFSSHYYKIVG